MTRGRKMGDNQRAQWMSMPACAKINEAHQDLTGTGLETSDINKEASTARMSRDKNDISAILEFLRLRNPFEGYNTLRNIYTGIRSSQVCQCRHCKRCLKENHFSITSTNTMDNSFQKSHQVATISSKCKAKIDGGPIDVHPQLLFQRRTTAANGMFKDPSEIFKYEFISVRSSPFDKDSLPREANKSTLADALQNTDHCSASDDQIKES